ncbi:MAG TPA: hypothetical protein VMB78_09155 [Dissulfurispiraceae bacterium]|nr:hypothetical protein [Dissulfurispiraceae bacterium]
MKVNFLTKLNTWLFVVPVLLILVAYFGIGTWFYFSGASYVLKDFHAAQLMTVLSDKKNSVELWIDVKKKALEELSKSSVLSDNLKKIAEGEAAPEAGQNISRFIEEFGQFRSVSFLSATGTVLWSTNAELAGREWPDKDIFTKGLGRSDVIYGKTGSATNADGLLFSMPLAISGEQQILIIAQPNAADMASSLKVEKGFYETGKVAVIDGMGRVVASKDATDLGNVRYNVRPAGLEGVDYRDGLFYSVVPLRNGQLKLIATLDAAEAAKPLRPLKTVYFSFAALIIVAILLQGFFVAPRLIGKPLSRLVKATRSIADGDLRSVNLRKGYVGELKAVAEGVAQMVVILNKQWAPAGSQAQGQDMQLSRVPSADAAWPEISRSLITLLDDMAGRLQAQAAGKDCPGALEQIKGLAMSLGDISAVMRLKGGQDKLLKREFGICDILKDAEESCRNMMTGKEIAIITECAEPSDRMTAVSDAGLMKRLCSAVLRNAIINTEVGTITLLASIISRDGTKDIELLFSDTGSGLEAAATEKIMKAGVYSAQYIDLCIGRDLAALLGGGMSIESTAGKGSLVTVIIPAENLPDAPIAEKVS